MKHISKLMLLLAVVPRTALAAGDPDSIIHQAQANLDTARIVCGGISDKISKITGQTVANAVVTGVGTVAGGGATAAGIMKSVEDKKIDELMHKLCDMTGGCNAAAVAGMADEDFAGLIQPLAEISDIEIEIAVRTRRSISLGNWRTGLMVGGAASGIASAILAGINSNQSDLVQHVSACNMALDGLRATYSEMLGVGINPMENDVMKRIRNATDTCRPINESDVDKIEKRMKTVMGTGIGTAAINIAGAVTSGKANSNSVRTDDSASGMQREKNLNTAANVMAGVGTVTSLVGTGMNISLINLTKQLMTQAKQCEEAL